MCAAHGFLYAANVKLYHFFCKIFFQGSISKHRQTCQYRSFEDCEHPAVASRHTVEHAPCPQRSAEEMGLFFPQSQDQWVVSPYIPGLLFAQVSGWERPELSDRHLLRPIRK